jgi:hypothetical protein
MTPILSAKAMHSRYQDMKLCCEVRTHFYRHAGNRVSSVYCVNYRVEGKPGLITCSVEFVRLYFNFVGTNFVENCIGVSFVLL